MTTKIQDDNEINDNNNDNCYLSICIPRVDETITDEYISKIFYSVLYGKNDVKHNIIEKIDLIARTNEKGETYKRAFIHFCNWDKIDTTNSIAIWNKLQSGEIIKIMHNQPSYWKCSLSRVPRPKYDDNNSTLKNDINEIISDNNIVKEANKKHIKSNNKYYNKNKNYYKKNSQTNNVSNKQIKILTKNNNEKNGNENDDNKIVNNDNKIVNNEKNDNENKM